MPNKQDELELQKVFNTLDALIADTDISDVTADTQSFSDLPEGHFLVEVVNMELRKAKSSDAPQVYASFKTVGNGYTIDDDGELVEIQKTANRRVNKFYTFKESRDFTQFVADMLKFEGDKPGEPLLPKQAFIDSRVIADSLDALKGARVYINISKGGWVNLVSWTAATKLGLPE